MNLDLVTQQKPSVHKCVDVLIGKPVDKLLIN